MNKNNFGVTGNELNKKSQDIIKTLYVFLRNPEIFFNYA